MTLDRLRQRLRSAPPALYQLGPRPPGSFRPSDAGAGCIVCRGPVRRGYARCYQCGRHGLLGRGLLADAVVPVSYAIKGTVFAGDLWRYKARLAPSASARTSVLGLLLAFLSDHGPCVWRYAGMPAPDRLAVVPTGCGRPGPHPLLRLVSPYLRLPVTPLVIRPGRQGRDLDLGRFQAGRLPAGATVLLLDDTWVSGASAQSAAAALRLAGASRVAIVILGRHLDPADPLSGALITGVAPAPYDPSTCAVHRPGILMTPCAERRDHLFIPVHAGNGTGKSPEMPNRQPRLRDAAEFLSRAAHHPCRGPKLEW